MTPLGQAALKLAGKGFAVFPLLPRTKTPYSDDKFFKTVGGFKCATRDQSLIEFWWSRQPEANIGLATGSVSGVWVLDVDGDAGREALAALEEQHGQLPPTVEVVTPGKIDKDGRHTGKGRHLYFAYPLGRDIRNTQDHPDLHVRGNGGYVLLPPSMHPDGTGTYAWSVDSADTFAEAPEWLTELITNKGVGNAGAAARSPEAWRTFLADTYEASRRSGAVAQLYGLLIRRCHPSHHPDPVLALDIVRMFNTLRCQPPLPDDKIVEIANGIAHREAASRRTRHGHR
jgi:hypothetical protein